MTLPLLAPKRPPAPPERIQVVCADALTYDWPKADLVLTDPPWLHTQRVGEPVEYPTMGSGPIVDLLQRLEAPRHAVWCTSAHLGDVLSRWPMPTTIGAWVKSNEENGGHYGQGYHWAGCAEYVLVWADGAYNNKEELRNAWVEPGTQHSRKPVAWQRAMVERWVPPGGLVIDPFCGLGSAAEAVLLAGQGRRYLGTEIDPRRHEGALALLAQVRP